MELHAKRATVQENRMRVLGLEPKTYGLKGRCCDSVSDANKELTGEDTSDLSTCLDTLLQQNPDLARLIEVWPDLPNNIKQALKALLQTHSMETE